MTKKIKVNSSNLEFVEYIADRKELRIWFLNEKNIIYAYANITQKIYDELIKASSVGGFFNHYIRYQYKFKRKDDVNKDILEVDCPHCLGKVEVNVSIYGYKLEEI
ncbi:MAG TPA: KTSC domain-containing protein [Candidatus Pacearchaeota archaeon]|nr:KTSC domain-containing protein [Candidatus Pacearchaeota archaeon]